MSANRAASGSTVMAELAIRPNGTMKGLINDDNRRDLSDAVFLLNFLFLGGKAPAFPAFADVNGSGKVDISDAVAELVFLFAGREVDMERTECEEECLSDADPARCRAACAEAARRMKNNIGVTVGGAEFDCLLRAVRRPSRVRGGHAPSTTAPSAAVSVAPARV